MIIFLVGDKMERQKIKVWGAGFACVDIIKCNEHEEIMPGGTAANVLSILALLGFPAVYVGVEYKDELGQWLNSALKKRGLKILNFARSNVAAPRVIETLDISGRHAFKTVCPICGKELAKIILPTARHIGLPIIQGIKATNLFYYDRFSEGIKLLLLQNQNGWNFYEPNSCRVFNTFLEAARATHILKFSQDKVPHVYIERLITELQESKIQLLIISMGKEGFRFSYRGADGLLGDWIYVSASEVDFTVDDSGAGDWMTAVFIFFFLQEYPFFTNHLNGDSIWKILDISKKIAAYKCGFLGAQGILHDQRALRELQLKYQLNIPEVIDEEYRSSGECMYCKI